MLSYLTLKELQPFLHRFFGSEKYTIRPIRYGLLNQNLAISSGRKKYVLKAYRPELSESEVDEIHALMKFVSHHEIPATLPLAETKIKGYVTVMYPFVQGEHPARYRNPSARMASMGEMLGLIHSSLDDYQPSGKKPGHSELIKSWQPKKSLTEIRDLRKLIKDKPVAVRREMSGILDAHEKAISEENWDSEPFLQLPLRYLHGDYHTRNILMKQSKITAVLDWEKANWGFRGQEIMRSIIFNCRRTSSELSWSAIEIYLKGYRKHASLNQLERELAFEAGSRNVVFGFWAMKQYLDGRKELRSNVLRRVVMMKDLVKHRKEYAERISDLIA